MEITLAEVAKKAGLTQKKVLAWEGAGYIQPLFQRRGPRRLVRGYSEKMAAVISRAAELVRTGYTLNAAFKIAREEGSRMQEGGTR